jgi:hypothetical protein
MLRSNLVADCARCAALCCVAPSFERSEDFSFTKPAGEPCRYLAPDCRCSIHHERLVRGLPGCTVYECHGAGPYVTRAFESVPGDEAARNAAFLRVRAVHELLWLTAGALELCPAHETELRAELEQQAEALEALAARLLREERDTGAHAAATHALLRRVGAALGGRRSLRVLAAG